MTLSEITPNRYDWRIEEAVNLMRTLLLREPAVMKHLQELEGKREEWKSSPNRGKMREATLGGEPGFLIAADFSERRRYECALEASPLREFFSVGQLDRLVTIVGERVEAGLWGKFTPVNDMGAGYNREKQRARAMSRESIELVVADFVQRLNPPEPDHDGAIWVSCPRCDATPGDECEGHTHAARLRAAREAARPPGVSAAAVRKIRQRARRLSRL